MKKGWIWMKKVMVYAYSQFNLGDDLFIKILCERYPETQFVLYAPKQYKRCFQGMRNIRFFPSDAFFVRSFNYIFKHLHIRKLLAKSCDAAVHIGGSLFIQGEDWRKMLENTKAMRISGKPFFLLGANFGPFHDKQFYQEHKQIFSSYTDTCFREKYSYDLFKDLPNVRMAADIVFQLKKPIIPKRENHIVISVIKPSIRKYLASYDALYYEKIKDVVVYFAERGYHVTLMAFCTYEGDHEAIDHILDEIPVDYLGKITKHVYQLNIEETLQIIASASFVVASRFHAMILGWVYGIPVFSIAYSDKMKHVMHDVGFQGTSTDFEQLETLQAADVFASMQTDPLDISRQIDDSENHFTKLDAYLKG